MDEEKETLMSFLGQGVNNIALFYIYVGTNIIFIWFRTKLRVFTGIMLSTKVMKIKDGFSIITLE
jgi:hypothetical protein